MTDDSPSSKPGEGRDPQDTSKRGLGRWLAVLPVVIFFALATVFLVRILSGDDISQVPSVLINKAAPSFSLEALPGLMEESAAVPGFETADLQGQVSLVNIFASWCVPCRQEHPYLVELAKRDDLQIVGINHKDEPDNALEFLVELKNPYDRVGIDRDGRISIEWGVYGVPETFVVDAQGCVRAKHIGPLTPVALEQNILPMIAELQDASSASLACQN